MRLAGRVALITGSARGIGLAIAERFARDGAAVMLSDVDAAKGASEAERLRAEGFQAAFQPCDVTDETQVAALVEAGVATFGNVDIAVNNAGIVHGADFLDLAPADFDRVLSINLRGAFLFGQRAARRMVQQVEAGRAPGSIINMSSVNAQVTIATQTAYCVSKGGLAQLTRVMSISLAKYGIRVNAIGPGSIATDILAKVASDDAMRRTLLSRTPLLRFGQPAEIAGIAAFLASDDASYVTGETIVADGGRMALNYVVPVPESL
jgi:NAD(P)-dependent dehydrogenase (short-subunit alcohol dehydrogenase family)